LKTSSNANGVSNSEDVGYPFAELIPSAGK
jgi:hypothetical protein